MSPGKPGAGGAGTRRTGWRRRRRRRRLETETRAPGFGHTAGRVPGTFQGAQGMKPAARETRTPPRSPGLRWALLPLLLLLRQGQVLCAGAAPNPIFDIEAVVSPTSVLLTWKHNDSGASECRIENKMESNLTFPVKNQTSCNITGLSPGTSYTFSIISVTTNETLNKTITTKPWPVSNLHVTSMGVTQARLTWSNANGTASYRMLIEKLTTHSSINISGLKPGTNNSFAFPESNKTQANFAVAEEVPNANGTKKIPVTNLSQLHKNSLVSVDPPSGQDPSLTKILLTNLKPNTQYNATIYSQAANGTKKQPKNKVFKTNSTQVSNVQAINISASSITLT